MKVRRDMAQAPHRGQREIGRINVKGETLADQPVDLVLVIERIAARGHAPRAMPEQIERQPRIARLGQRDRLAKVGDIIVDAVDEEALALRPPAPAQVERGDREARLDEPPRRPIILPAMRIDPVAQHHRAARILARPPVPREDARPAFGLQILLGGGRKVGHGNLRDSSLGGPS